MIMICAKKMRNELCRHAKSCSKLLLSEVCRLEQWCQVTTGSPAASTLTQVIIAEPQAKRLSCSLRSSSSREGGGLIHIMPMLYQGMLYIYSAILWNRITLSVARITLSVASTWPFLKYLPLLCFNRDINTVIIADLIQCSHSTTYCDTCNSRPDKLIVVFKVDVLFSSGYSPCPNQARLLLLQPPTHISRPTLSQI